MKKRTIKMGLLAAILILVIAVTFCDILVRWHNVNSFVSAAENGDVQSVRRYIRDGINVNALTDQGVNAIEMASYSGQNEVVRVLLDAGASPNEGLYEAILTKNMSTIKLLVSRGATVNKPDADYGLSPLEFAKQNSSKEVVQLLESGKQ